MQSANFTALPRALSVLFPPAPALLAVPVSEDAFEPQPALIRPIRATSARAANGRSVLLMIFSKRVDWLTPVLCGRLLVTAASLDPA
jgi:hypothetical protein